MRRIAAAEVPLPYAKVMELSALPSAQHLIDAVRATVAASGGTRRNGSGASANGASGNGAHATGAGSNGRAAAGVARG